MKQLDLFAQRTSAAPAPVDCRRAARRAIEPQLGPLQGEVLRFIVGRGDVGATDDELAFGLHLLRHTATPRRVELAGLGLVRDSGRQRRTRFGRMAAVWIAAEGVTTGAELEKCDRPSTGAVVRTAAGQRCEWCGQSKWWRSAYGERVCRVCSPPVFPALIASRGGKRPCNRATK